MKMRDFNNGQRVTLIKSFAPRVDAEYGIDVGMRGTVSGAGYYGATDEYRYTVLWDGVDFEDCERHPLELRTINE